MWYCYILRNKLEQFKHNTYNGSTNHPMRRLRQHNEEIKGGARATHGKGGAWEICAMLSGFPDHINALSCVTSRELFARLLIIKLYME